MLPRMFCSTVLARNLEELLVLFPVCSCLDIRCGIILNIGHNPSAKMMFVLCLWLWKYFLERLFQFFFVRVTCVAVHKYHTRLATSKHFFLPGVNSSQGQCSLKIVGPKVWSEIPDHIKFRSRFDFKHQYKNCLLSGRVGAMHQMQFV